jgi:YihY family inner membrane protein
MNRVEHLVRRFDSWQQRHPLMAFVVAVIKKFGDDQAGNQVALLTYYAFVATFPLLLALTTILGVALRKYPGLQHDLVNSAFAEFPIIGAKIHDQLGVATFGNTVSLTVGVLGAVFGGRGFANALQTTFSTLWSVPKVDRPGFPTKYLRAAGLLLLLTVGAAVTAAAGAAAGAATALGLGGLSVRLISIAVGSVLGWAYFLAAYRIATPARVPTRSMLPGAAISAVAWQLLLTGAGVITSHLLRHAQAVAGLFGIVLGLLAWFGLQATVVVYAVEADVVRARHLWPRSLVPPPLTDADKAYYTDAVRVETQRPEQRIDIQYLPTETTAAQHDAG